MPFCLNDDRLDDFASVCILDGIQRCAVSEHGDRLIHPAFPVRCHHLGKFLTHFRQFSKPLLLLCSGAVASTARCTRFGQHFFKRLNLACAITNAVTEFALDQLSYGGCPRCRIDLCGEALTVNLYRPHRGIVPCGVYLVAALHPGETHAREFACGIASRIRQLCFFGFIKPEVL